MTGAGSGNNKRKQNDNLKICKVRQDRKMITQTKVL